MFFAIAVVAHCRSKHHQITAQWGRFKLQLFLTASACQTIYCRVIMPRVKISYYLSLSVVLSSLLSLEPFPRGSLNKNKHTFFWKWRLKGFESEQRCAAFRFQCFRLTGTFSELHSQSFGEHLVRESPSIILLNDTDFIHIFPLGIFFNDEYSAQFYCKTQVHIKKSGSIHR